MKHLTSLVFMAMAVVADATTAQTTSLNTCLSTAAATCQDLSPGGILLPDCQREFQLFFGRVSWYPLRYAGPIRIEIESKSTSATRFPLYVEVVPLRNIGGGPCDNAPGEVVMVINGGPDPCGTWQGVGPLDLSHGGLLSLGDLYALRIQCFGQLDREHETPGLDCVRITPTISAAIEAHPWTSIKRLYQ